MPKVQWFRFLISNIHCPDLKAKTICSRRLDHPSILSSFLLPTTSFSFSSPLLSSSDYQFSRHVMSQPSTPIKATGQEKGKTVKPLASFTEDAVIVTSSNAGPYIGGKKFGLDSDVTVKFVISNSADENPWVGFSMVFPIGAENEDLGFGVRFQPVRQHVENFRIETSRSHRIAVSNNWAVRQSQINIIFF
jgi:hypothetical protein